MWYGIWDHLSTLRVRQSKDSVKIGKNRLNEELNDIESELLCYANS